MTGQAAERSYRKPAVSAKSREKFLQALASGWTATPAAARAGLTRQRLYELRDADEAFAGEWEAAVEAGTHVLEDEALRRAVEGYDEDTLDGDGNLIRRVRRYDSALVIVGVTRT